MLKEYEAAQAFNLNLNLKPLADTVPGGLKVRRLTQNFRAYEATRTRESTYLDTYFESAGLSPETRLYVLDLLNEALTENPEATVDKLRKDLNSLPQQFKDRPELKEAMTILFG